MGDDTVNATLADPDRAPVSNKVKVTLRLLERVTRDHRALTPEDFAPVLAAGVAPDAIVEALNVASVLQHDHATRRRVRVRRGPAQRV